MILMRAAAVLLAVGLLIGQAQGAEDIESVFQRLLQNPSDVELNLLYARPACLAPANLRDAVALPGVVEPLPVENCQ